MDANQAFQEQLFRFYKPELREAATVINQGKSLVFVGINSIGKTQLAQQLTSSQFSKQYLGDIVAHIVLLDFKHTYPPSAAQVYKQWFTQTAQALSYPIDPDIELNGFTFYSEMMAMIGRLHPNERLIFLLLDAHQLLTQDEEFFRSLIFFHRYAHDRLSFILLSEPHILNCTNPWARRFIQYYVNFKYHFLRPFDRKTTLMDIKQQESIQGMNFETHYSLILQHSHGLHGVTATFCLLLRAYPHIRTIRTLMNTANDSEMCQYWVWDVLDSLPVESLRLLNEVAKYPESFKRYQKKIFAKWLVDLTLLKKNGDMRYPLMKPLLERYRPSEKKESCAVRLANGKFFYAEGKTMKLTKKEYAVLRELYQSKGKVVTYDRISRVLWSDSEEEFSLWAISQLIRRLRNKLATYFIHPQTLRSIRGEGYVLH